MITQLNTRKGVDFKVITWLLSISGISAWFLGIIANWGDWKAAILFLIGAAYGVARLIAFISREWDAKRMRQLKIEKEQLEIQDMKRGHDSQY